MGRLCNWLFLPGLVCASMGANLSTSLLLEYSPLLVADTVIRAISWVVITACEKLLPVEPRLFKAVKIAVLFCNVGSIPLLYMESLCDQDIVNADYDGSASECFAAATSMIFVYLITWHIWFYSWGFYELAKADDLDEKPTALPPVDNFLGVSITGDFDRPHSMAVSVVAAAQQQQHGGAAVAGADDCEAGSGGGGGGFAGGARTFKLSAAASECDSTTGARAAARAPDALLPPLSHSRCGSAASGPAADKAARAPAFASAAANPDVRANGLAPLPEKQRWWLGGAGGVWRAVVSPPNVAVLLGVTIGVVPALREGMFHDATSPLRPIGAAIVTIGQPTIALQTLLMAARSSSTSPSSDHGTCISTCDRAARSSSSGAAPLSLHSCWVRRESCHQAPYWRRMTFKCTHSHCAPSLPPHSPPPRSLAHSHGRLQLAAAADGGAAAAASAQRSLRRSEVLTAAVFVLVPLVVVPAVGFAAFVLLHDNTAFLRGAPPLLQLLILLQLGMPGAQAVIVGLSHLALPRMAAALARLYLYQYVASIATLTALAAVAMMYVY
ncbi:hypothetical protein JKP88DRAFT_304328 [Tribonema minus]|uniref:PIN-like protein n=1 Tax=Tribonema minus TaxID=303371 RepID=A0A835Z6D5_9STRA|nr:hypothetical protein JKP88DRAFT_304328 [Tribonema minus]